MVAEEAVKSGRCRSCAMMEKRKGLWTVLAQQLERSNYLMDVTRP